ncbi:MAG: adenylate/guanylate cyclase domain-containing protein [Anaerolineales bacterium]
MPTSQEIKYPEERRLVSVLFADIIGFSALADQLDFEIVGDILKELWIELDQIIEEHGGYIDKHIGDAFMVIWGAPNALEDDAERAVSAGLAIIKGLEKFIQSANHPAAKLLQLRVGVHTGLALAAYVGIRGEYTVMGNTVNVAKRMEETGVAGSVVVSDATLQYIRGAYRVKSLTPIPLKGTKRLVNIFQVVGELSQPTKLRYRSKGGLETILVGREREIAKLEEIYEQIQNQKTPQFALVTGDIGIGKSRLLFEFAGQLEVNNPTLTMMSSRALEQTSQVPYYIWKELWSNRFELNEDDPVESARKKTIDGVRTLWGQMLGEVAAIEVAHFLGDQIGIQWEKSPYLDSLGSDSKLRTERSFFLQAELFYRASQRGPIVLLLDDLQWADSGSLDMIISLSNNHDRDFPLLILASARTEFIKDKTDLLDNAELIELSPLPISGEIVREAYPALEEAPDHLLQALAERSQGNPYFLEELVKNILSLDDVNLMDIDISSQLPQSLHILLQSRLDSLSLEGRATALFAAVAGRVFWKGAILAAFRQSTGVTEALGVSGHNIVGKVQSALDELMEKEMAFPRVGGAFSGEREYIFKHSLLRDAAYERAPKKNRIESHSAIAEWLAERAGPERSVTVAHHYEAAGCYDQAQEYYTRAAEHARSIGNTEEADEIQYHARTLPENKTG